MVAARVGVHGTGRDVQGYRICLNGHEIHTCGQADVFLEGLKAEDLSK
jgi:hypothetical protein